MRKQAECFRLVYDSGPRYVNDHSFVQGKDGTYHLFHIVGPVGKGCYDPGSEVSFGHATSRDLLAWKPAPSVLAIDPDSSHEPHHIFAPYVCAKDGIYFLYYAGINQELKAESMCLATSADLFHWSKHPSNPVFRPSRHWADYEPGSGTWGCCRDPHVLKHSKLGHILYFVTWIKGTRARLVALGAAVSPNLVSWQDAGPVMIREMATEHSTTSMESPCVVERDGLYYLFYKHRDETRLAVSDDPLKFTDKDDAWFSVAHAAEVFEAGGKWYVSSCSRDLLDVRHEKTDRTKGLYLACIQWENRKPRIMPFAPL
jgi:beta-fructofuranosidase